MGRGGLTSTSLGRLRVVAGRLGLDQRTFAHLPPDEEERALVDFVLGVIEGLERTGRSLHQQLDVIDMVRGVTDETTVRFPDKR